MKKIVYLFGGPGVEKEVSKLSAQAALPEFPTDYQLLPVFIDTETLWSVPQTYCEPAERWDVAKNLMAGKGLPAEIALDAIQSHTPDLVFIGLHGEYGEDGTVQKLLADRGLRFTGSSAEASALAMNKPKVLQLLQDEGIATPEFLEIDAETHAGDIEAFADHVGYPVVVLPADRGSSIGVSKVNNADALITAVEKALEVSDHVMISQWLKGKEVTCGLLVTTKEDLTPLPPTEVIPATGHDLWDYEAKYTKGQSEDITPAHLEESVLKEVQATAKRVHQLVGADGYSRVDMIVVDGSPHVLEINTLPGMTPTSIVPQEAEVAGYSFSKLLELICSAAESSVH